MRLMALTALIAVSGCTADADRPARWSYIHAAVIQPSCTTSGCHSRQTALAGVDLAGSEDAYLILTGRICGAAPSELDPPGNFVVPFDVARSKLYHMLVGDNTDQMPPDVALPRVEIELIARWIEAGAECD